MKDLISLSVFRVILWGIGMLLALASRLNPRLRAQLTRDMTVVVASREGVARSYVFRDRRASSHAGVSPKPNLVLTFPSASAGARILCAPDAVLRIVRGLTARQIELVGAPAHVLWFYEMVIAYLPWRKKRYHVAPNAYTAHDPNGKAADRITREPAVEALDPSWTSAVIQREKLDIWRVGRGELAPGRVPGFNHIADVPDDPAEKPS